MSNQTQAQNEDKILLVCPHWPGRNSWLEVRKLTCRDCKADVSATKANLPIVAEKKVEIICEECFEKLKASGQEVIETGKPLRSIGSTESHFHPCAECSEPYECYCQFPDLEFGDEFQMCARCRRKA